jgi:hypothetical protein
MTWQQLTLNLAKIEVPAIFWAGIAFVLLYTILAPWWKNSFGRALVAMDLAVSAALFPAVLSTEFGVQMFSAEFIAWLEVAAFSVVFVVIMSRMYLLAKVNKDRLKVLGKRLLKAVRYAQS